MLSLVSAMLFLAATVFAQERRITGKVTDESGNAVQNATVMVVGGTQGVSTDAAGNFAITVPGGAKSLRISAVGFGTRDQNLGSQSTLNVSLVSEARQMDDVVVVAYGTARR